MAYSATTVLPAAGRQADRHEGKRRGVGGVLAWCGRQRPKSQLPGSVA